jgi:hypothetical protein
MRRHTRQPQTFGWSRGLAEWREGDTVYISVVFTWKLEAAYTRAVFARAEGFKVKIGGPALFPATAIKTKLSEKWSRSVVFDESILARTNFRQLLTRVQYDPEFRQFERGQEAA